MMMMRTVGSGRNYDVDVRREGMMVRTGGGKECEGTDMVKREIEGL